MAEDKRKKWNQWAEVLWNIILIVGCMYFFCRLLADMNESGFARMAAENRILLPVLGVFLLNMAASTWKNIQKPGACDEQGGSAPEKKPGKGGYTCSWICTGVSSGTVSLSEERKSKLCIRINIRLFSWRALYLPACWCFFYIGAGRSGRGTSWRSGIGTARSSGCGQNHFRDSAVLLPYGS